MKKLFTLWVALLLVAVGNARAQAPSSHYKAAETLLLTMGSPKIINDNLQQMLTMQMEQVPEMKVAELEVRSFFTKYMNWDSVKEDLIKMYMDEFTEKELKEMNTFFKTPTGQKLAARQASISLKSAQIGQSKVEPHMMELEQAIKKKMLGDN